ncbi:MAG: hypothetical protein J5629_07000 [Muribaculaceae bacterium]|nr:hypothetical protein [Muribaculaceae bacterium]
MKTFTRNIIMVAVMLLAMGTGSAMAQDLRDANYNIVGKIAANGTVRNINYDPIGYFNNDGTITNGKGKTVGRIDNKMQIFNKAGERIGYINADGSVNDGESKTLGFIEVKSGKVTTPEGEVLGYANGISIQRVAAYYFFDFFK